MQVDVRRLMEEKQELHQNLQEELHRLRVQNQELRVQVPGRGIQEPEHLE